MASTATEWPSPRAHLGAAGALADGAQEEGTAEEIAGFGEAGEEAVALADGLLVIQQ
jgi:hypothetical protein